MTPRRRVFPLFIPHAGCGHGCVYCAQRSVTGQAAPVGPEAVSAALEALAFDVDELAFYGGSFTALPFGTQRALLDAAAPFLAAGKIKEIRVSTRPDAIDGGVLTLLERRGVGTIELGAQSMDDGVLSRCRRGHTAADTLRAVAQVREHGNFGLVLQMMTGLPGSTDEIDCATAEALAALEPDGVRIYPAVILRETPLYELWRRGGYREHTVEDAVRVCAKILPIFEAAGIPVIRLGLNPTEELSNGGTVAGGAYHPALGELVKSRILLERARALLLASGPGEVESVVLGVNEREVSQMTGQHRRNLAALESEFHLRSVRVAAAGVPPGGLVLNPGAVVNVLE